MKRLPLLTLAPMAWGLFAAGATAQSPPNSVFIEELTRTEIQALMDAGKTSVIIATGGTEQKGPHMVMGEHNIVLRYTTDKIARILGNALVSPIVSYVPEGSWEGEGSGHMRYPGTITLPNEQFQILLTNIARSHQSSGFTDIILLGDSGGNRGGMQSVADQLNQEWSDTEFRVHYISDYYDTGDLAEAYITQELGIDEDEIGSHAGMLDTSELWFVNEHHIRQDLLAPDGGFDDSGVSGNPTLASPALGERLLRFKIDNAVAQIRASLESR